MELEEKLRSLTKERGIKMEAIYSAIGMSNAGFYKMLRNNTMKVETLEKIAEILDVPIVKFFDSVDTRSKEREKEIQNLNIQIEQLTELNKTYRKLIEFYENESTGNKASAIHYLNLCLATPKFDALSEEDKEKVRLYVRKNDAEFNKAVTPTFNRYDSIKHSEEWLIEKLSEVASMFISKKKILG